MSKDKGSVNAAVLEQLFVLISNRKAADPETSYTADLFNRGRGEIARKLVEEATEIMLAALTEPPERLTSESADLLYHLMVLWVDVGIKPESVWAELSRRQGVSGIQEKRSRITV